MNKLVQAVLTVIGWWFGWANARMKVSEGANIEVDEDFVDAVAAVAEDGKMGITDGTLGNASGEAYVRFHVADLGLDDAAAPQKFAHA